MSYQPTLYTADILYTGMGLPIRDGGVVVSGADGGGGGAAQRSAGQLSAGAGSAGGPGHLAARP